MLLPRYRQHQVEPVTTVLLVAPVYTPLLVQVPQSLTPAWNGLKSSVTCVVNRKGHYKFVRFLLRIYWRILARPALSSAKHTPL
jgi:hypothetical protein